MNAGKPCDLDGCNKPARRRFCCNQHKDRFHNLKNPRGKFAHLAADDQFEQQEKDMEAAGHFMSSGYFGHGQS